MRKHLLGAVAALTLTVTAAEAAVDLSTLVQWNSGPGANGHYYALTDAGSSWSDADAAAGGAGGYLTSVLSLNENDFLRDSFFPGASTAAFWIGVNDAAAEGTYVWTSGEAFSFTNWSSGEPNNFVGGVSTDGEDFGVINWYFRRGLGQQGTWNDVPNTGCTALCAESELYRAIVEFNSDPRQAPIPEPASIAALAAGLLGLGLARRRRTPAGT